MLSVAPSRSGPCKAGDLSGDDDNDVNDVGMGLMRRRVLLLSQRLV